MGYPYPKPNAKANRRRESGRDAASDARSLQVLEMTITNPGIRYYSKSSLKVTRLRQTVQTMCSAHTI